MHERMNGKTNWKVFWAVLGASLVVVSGLAGLVANGAIAMAATIPVPFQVSADSITSSDGSFQLVPGSAPNTSPVAVVTMNGSLSNLQITKSVTIAGVTGTLTISAGAGSTPVNATNLTTDASSIQADQAQFTNLVQDASDNGKLSTPGGSMTLNNATLQIPYLSASSITLPGMRLSVSVTAGQ